MPPRRRVPPRGIELVPPPGVAIAAAAAANFDDELPVKFYGKERRWVTVLPFLSWEPELVAPPAEPSFFLISLFAIEALLVPLLFPAKLAETILLDTHCVGVEFLAKLLRALKGCGLAMRPYFTQDLFLDAARIALEEYETAPCMGDPDGCRYVPAGA